MALMTKLRDKTHIVLYTLLAAFLALIVFEWGMNFSGFTGGGVLAGKVNGTPVEYRNYEQVYDSLVDNFRRTSPQAEITDELERELRQRAWNILVDQILLEDALQSFSVHVADAEVLAAVESDSPPMIIRQNFINPETGEIDRDRFEQARMDPANSDIWLQIEEIIRRELMVQKLQRVLGTTVKVTSEELDALYDRQFASYSATFLTLPFSAAGPDSLFGVSDRELNEYYESNRDLFRQEPMRSLDYVSFPALPTGRDSVAVRMELEGLAAEFAASDDDSSFVSLQSDRGDTFNKRYTRADFSPAAAAAVFDSASLTGGAIIGPVADRNVYRLLKIRKSGTDGTVVRASHILLGVPAGDAAARNDAEERAASIMKELKNGKSFDLLAREFSDDPGSAPHGGDLGWFAKGAMVPDFEKAAFGAAPGRVVGPVATQFGLHIIKVTGRDNRFIDCSEVVRSIRPSSNTLESVRRTAAEFQIEAVDKGFQTASGASALKVSSTGPFTKNGMIPGIGFNNQITRFAFDASKGDVSDVVATDDAFVVLQVTERNDSGYRSLDETVRDQITRLLRDRKKGVALDAMLSAGLASSKQNLEALSRSLVGSKLVKASDIRRNAESAYDPYLLEALSGMKPSSVSLPVETSSGRALIALESKTYPEGMDPDEARRRLRPLVERAKTEQVIEDYFNALRREATIEDMRRL